MVVSQDDARAVALGCISDDLPQRERGAALVAVVARYMQATGLIIDMGDPQAFARRIGLSHTTGKEVTSGTEAVQFQREFGTLIPHAAAVGDSSIPNDEDRIRNGLKFLFDLD